MQTFRNATKMIPAVIKVIAVDKVFKNLEIEIFFVKTHHLPYLYTINTICQGRINKKY